VAFRGALVAAVAACCACFLPGFDAVAPFACCLQIVWVYRFASCLAYGCDVDLVVCVCGVPGAALVCELALVAGCL
jgi:hypothetical protein